MNEFQVMEQVPFGRWICTSLPIYEALERMKLAHPGNWDFGVGTPETLRAVNECTHGWTRHLHWFLYRH